MRAMGIILGLVLGAAALALPSCNSSSEPTFQGWIEANLIFVSPDETGRVETLAVREGDTAGELTARVSFISRTAEYTPPVIYSLEERSKLVFLIEARPEQPDKLRVGQPVSVALAPPGAQEAKR